MVSSVFPRDLGALFASSDFGEADGDIVYKGNSIEGIFDDEDVEFQLGEGVPEIHHQIMVTAKSADFPNIADGDILTIRGNPHIIRNWKDDGTGVIEVFLEKSP